MVQLMRSDTDNHCLKKVKLEVQDEIAPLHTHKRPKLESPPKVSYFALKSEFLSISLKPIINFFFGHFVFVF